MSRVVFVGPHAALAATLGNRAADVGPLPEGAVAEAIDELDVPPALCIDAPTAGDEVVDTGAWGLPEFVGLCLEEVRELRSTMELRLSRPRSARRQRA